MVTFISIESGGEAYKYVDNLTALLSCVDSALKDS